MASDSATTRLESLIELKAWIRAARKQSGTHRLTQCQLAARLGVSKATITAWENQHLTAIPGALALKAIAQACGAPLPVVAFDTRIRQPSSVAKALTLPVASNLDEDILRTGRILSACAHAASNGERNAEIFRARYGGSGTDDSTLQAIGDVHGLTRERVRQIVDKQLSFVPSVALGTACFDALAAACLNLEPQPVLSAEARLRPYLGGALSLQGASAYGREVLGRPLPVQFVQIPSGDTIVLRGDLPAWYQLAITQAKAMIGHCGAAQHNLAWALTMRQHQEWIAPEEFRQVMSHAPGFEWIDDEETWFWFGPEGSANRLIKRTIEILIVARRPLDVEVIYGGLTRYARTRDSAVAEEAGVWPPIEVFRKLLAKSPALVCQQGDDFRLAEAKPAAEKKSGVAEAIVAELELRGGVASRSELHRALVVEKGINIISFSVALAHSPLLRQVDRSIFAIRGWPISAARLTEAQHRIGNLDGPRINFKEVDVRSNGDVSWVNMLSKASLTNLYAGVPRKARLHLSEGPYTATGATLSIVDTRMTGLVRLVLNLGGSIGTLFRVTANARRRTATVELLGQGEADEDLAEL